MDEFALAAPAPCNNPQHPHPSALHGAAPRTLRQEGGEALALAGIVHDGRNLVTAMRLCSELIAEPGVLGPAHGHYAQELRSMADVAGQLMRRLAVLSRNAARAPREPYGHKDTPIADLARAVQELRPLLGAVAGPAIVLETECLPCAGELRLSEESLTRILMNLVRNAADALPNGGHIRITAQRSGGASFRWTVPGLAELEPAAGGAKVLLSVEDDGPGIPFDLLDRIFDPGFSTRRDVRPWPEAAHRGLGLSIVRQLVEEAGGLVRAVVPPRSGARFEIELPLTNVTPSLPPERVLLTGGASQ